MKKNAMARGLTGRSCRLLVGRRVHPVATRLRTTALLFAVDLLLVSLLVMVLQERRVV